MSNNPPVAFFVDRSGTPMKYGIVLDATTGAPALLTQKSDGSWLISPIGAGGANVGNATPQPLGVAAAGSDPLAARQDHIHELPTAAQLNALGLPQSWDASANNPTLAAGTAPTGNNSYLVTVAGTIDLGNGITSQAVGDVVYFDGTEWQIILGSAALGIVTSLLIKGNGSGGAAAAVPGRDYPSPMSLQCTVPIIYLGAGTIGSNGALTLTCAALSHTFNSPGAWMYFPANSITGSNAAGWYWVVMTSTTVGTVYANTYTPGTNTGAGSWASPAALTPFSGTTGSAFTNATATDTTAIQLAVPGNSMGLYGTLDVNGVMTCSSSANHKTQKTMFGAGANPLLLGDVTANVNNALYCCMANTGQTNAQTLFTALSGGSSSIQRLHNTVDTTTSQNLVATLQIDATSEWAAYEMYRVTVTPGPQQ